MKVLSGIQPTGRFHWGNYFGAIKQYIELQTAEQAFYFIADLHAMTTIRGEPETLAGFSRDAAIDLLSLGLDPNQAVLFRQSDVPEITELYWALLTITQMHLLDKGHSFKEKKDRGLPADAGLYTYPILQAADILLYDSDTVPVGADQVQHIEITRDLAARFNHIYGETLVLPKAHVVEATGKVVGTDGEKMSKSYGNTIDIFEPTPKKLRKKIMAIKTDSTPVEDPKEPEGDSVFTLYKLFADDQQQAALAERYRAGGMGYGDAKQTLYEAAMDYFGPAFEKRQELEEDLDTVEDVLRAGAEKARAKGAEVLDRVRSAVGFKKRSSAP
ncbi:tryptophan--tRNA ligase [Stratiformator vulcanicus]|uniref:Tryptophan--tRNA ligase n=1 Tax=Stratiformator vulcanicus TaxID=2527980 RepID=A0A517QZJ6_9PLAN|nr:tryptophan--tRNA ligase [Stratiformator vulcanicus]QDT37066.1 Tryptophan--tRNA ligase [Stratiformator vulcanicus]